MHLLRVSQLAGILLPVYLSGLTMVTAAPVSTSNRVSRSENDDRLEAVKEGFLHAWDGYVKYAFGQDELRTVTNGASNSRNGWGASIFDALDTIIIMGLEEPYKMAMNHIASVDWKLTPDASKTFETNIRYLGGLLSAYDLRPDPMLLEKALELTHQVIMPAFNTPNGIPAAYVNVARGEPTDDQDIILAEFGSLQLELVRLSQITGNEVYGNMALHILEQMSKVPTQFPGLYPMTWDLKSFTPKDAFYTISGGSDSFYEYLLKTHILMGGNEELQLEMWRDAVSSMHNNLRSESTSGQVYLSEFVGPQQNTQTGELVCFIPGTLLLGARYLNDPAIGSLANELMDSCFDTWIKTPTGIAPETWGWISKGQNTKSYSEEQQRLMATVGYIPGDLSYDLRPETLESLFYFYRLTGNPMYQDMAWDIFTAINKYCRTATGYTRIADVTNPANVNPLDFEESYFFAETMKYLYLIFADPSVISLDEYIFNTEAHPFKLSKPIHVQAQFH